MQQVRDLFKKKPYLTWYVSNPTNLSEMGMLEHILNYGTWDDYLSTEKGLGIKKVNILFQSIKNKKRVNLRPQTLNYFNNYLTKYA